MRLPGEEGDEAQNASTKPKHGAKHAFILAQPRTMSGPEVVARAAERGLRFNAAYVSMVRMRARKAAERPPRRRGRPPKHGSGPAQATHEAAPRAMRLAQGSPEAAFRALVLEIGLVHAERLLARLRRKIAELRW